MAIQPVSNIEGQAHTEFELLVPDSEPLKFGVGAVTPSSSLLLESVHLGNRYTHRFTALSVDYVNTFLRKAMASGTPLFRFRFGVGVLGAIQWNPWQIHRITHLSAIPEGIGATAGHFLELETQDALFVADLPSKMVARRGTVAQMVRQIAQENKIADVVIEPTRGEFSLIQSFQSDTEFIRLRLIKRAVNDKGRGSYLLFIRDNVLHFHTADYQGQAYELEYYKCSSVSMTQADNTQQMIESGASGVRLVAYNPLTGETKETDAQPANVLRFANNLPQLAANQQADLNMGYHHSANGVEEAVSLAQNTYENARQQCYKLSMELDKIVFRPGDIVRMVLSPATQRTTPWSGFYLVAEASHNIVRNAIRSTYILQRGELLSILGGQPVVADSQHALHSAQEAPGHDLNVGEFGSSGLTKGTGKQASGKTFSVVKKPG